MLFILTQSEKLVYIVSNAELLANSSELLLSTVSLEPVFSLFSPMACLICMSNSVLWPVVASLFNLAVGRMQWQREIQTSEKNDCVLCKPVGPFLSYLSQAKRTGALLELSYSFPLFELSVTSIGRAQIGEGKSK